MRCIKRNLRCQYLYHYTHEPDLRFLGFSQSITTTKHKTQNTAPHSPPPELFCSHILRRTTSPSHPQQHRHIHPLCPSPPFSPVPLPSPPPPLRLSPLSIPSILLPFTLNQNSTTSNPYPYPAPIPNPRTSQSTAPPLVPLRPSPPLPFEQNHPTKLQYSSLARPATLAALSFVSLSGVVTV